MTPADTSSSRSGGLTDQALRLVTREATRLPLFALSVGLQAWQRTSGLREMVLRHGGEALQIAAHTPLGRFLPQPVLDDGADDEAERIVSHARQARLVPVAEPPKTADKAADKPTDQAKPAAAKPAPSKASTTPAAPKPHEVPEAAREVGAPGAVTDEVEAVAAKLDVEEPESREDLPIPDFDNVSLGSLRGRLRSLSLEQLVVLREWEQAHAHRLPVITLLDNRIAKVSAEPEQTTTNGSGSAHPRESTTTTGARAAEQAESAAEDEGGTLRV
ncbi:MAG TPA: hypothetical protein VFJ17_13470 [Mycobacteriales bacterium]|jgi:hypothetical protein|nr:hypothetical protein [Mycobacteriales bacterium]